MGGALAGSPWLRRCLKHGVGSSSDARAAAPRALDGSTSGAIQTAHSVLFGQEVPMPSGACRDDRSSPRGDLCVADSPFRKDSRATNHENSRPMPES